MEIITSINILKTYWETEGVLNNIFPQQSDFEAFETQNNLVLPNDLKQYFLILNGTLEEYNENFFLFESFNSFNTIHSNYNDWKGIPAFNKVLNKIINPSECYVFSNYLNHTFSYSIRLKENNSSDNEIYAICGEDFKLVSKSFSEFLDKYVNNSSELFI